MTKYDVLQNKSADLGQFASQCTGHSYFDTASLHRGSFKRLSKGHMIKMKISLPKSVSVYLEQSMAHGCIGAN